MAQETAREFAERIEGKRPGLGASIAALVAAIEQRDAETRRLAMEDSHALMMAAERIDKAIASVHGLGDQLSTEDTGLTINATWIDLRNALKAIRASQTAGKTEG